MKNPQVKMRCKKIIIIRPKKPNSAQRKCIKRNKEKRGKKVAYIGRRKQEKEK